MSKKTMETVEVAGTISILMLATFVIVSMVGLGGAAVLPFFTVESSLKGVVKVAFVWSLLVALVLSLLHIVSSKPRERDSDYY